MESERLVVTRDGAVALVELAREDRLNAFDGAAFEAFGETFRALGHDPSVRAIVLAGRGKHFTAGLDLDWAGALFAPAKDPARAAERRAVRIERLQATVNAIEKARAPVIAAVHGGCVGAGVDIVCACDMRVASADAFFTIAEIDVAIAADLGTLQRMPHLIPAGIVRELALTGRRMGAQEAARWGFVNQVAADRQGAIDAAMALARTIAAKSPVAVTGTKRLLNRTRGRPVEDGLVDVALWNAAAISGAEAAAIIAARKKGEVATFADLDD